VQKILHIPVPKYLSVQPKFLKHPVKLRARTSDPMVFQQIMIEDEYLPLKNLQISTMLDLGANIGLASAWFLSRFPNAAVFAVEAESDNYATCCENLEVYGSRARILYGAAWSRHALLTLRRKSCAADNSVTETQIGDAEKRQTQGWDLPSLIAMSGFSQIDLLKVDIEGAEAEIFSAEASNWLPRIRNVCIELHGQACRDVFFNALRQCDFEHEHSGELDLCTNLRPKMTT
jgi:FkbM family methyltransferase